MNDPASLGTSGAVAAPRPAGVSKAFRLQILLALSAAACISTSSPVRRADLARVAQLGLQEVERGRSPVIVVLRNENRPRVRSTIERFRRVIPAAAIPPVDGFTLPPGYFYLDRLEVEGDAAVFRGQIGPIPAPRPGVLLDACGTTFTIRLRRTSGNWIIDETDLMVC